MNERTLEPLEIFGVESFDESAVVIKARFKTQPIAQWSVGREYRRRLKKAFDARGIEMPFPHRTIYWGDANPAFKINTAPTSSGAADRGNGAHSERAATSARS